MFALGSGFGADQASYNGTRDWITTDDTLLFMLSLCSNIGGALAYNLPQMLLLADRATLKTQLSKADDGSFAKKSLILDSNLTTLEETLRHIDTDEIDDSDTYLQM